MSKQLIGRSKGDLARELGKLLPFERAERLSDHLTPTDVATLKDLVRASVPENSLRAL